MSVSLARPLGCQCASCDRRVLVTRTVPPLGNLDTFLGLGGVASWSMHSSWPGATTLVGKEKRLSLSVLRSANAPGMHDKFAEYRDRSAYERGRAAVAVFLTAEMCVRTNLGCGFVPGELNSEVPSRWFSQL